MQSNLRDLFGNSKQEKRKTPEQKQFEKENLALLLAFKDIVFEAFGTLHDRIFSVIKPGGGMDNKMPAVSIISLIRTGIIQKFPLYCGKATKSRFKLVTPAAQDNIYLKKLDFKRRPANRQSKANDLIMYQLTNSNKDKGGNVFLGYVTDKLYSSVLGIYAVCLDGKQRLWESDILDLARRQQAKIVRMKKKGEKLKLKETAIPIKNEQSQE